MTRGNLLQRLGGFVVILAVLIVPTLAQAATIKSMRFWQSPERTRVVLDVSSPVAHKVFSLSEPNRMVIDIEQSSIGFETAALDVKSELITRVRSNQTKGNVRLVLDLSKKAEHKVFALEPYQDYGHRLVIDLFNAATAKRAPKAKTQIVTSKRDIIVAIDAGHGGEDPGAIGRGGTFEKDVVLKVAKQLAALINKQKGMKAVLIRSGDYFIDLYQRSPIARQNRADIFVSIHADGFHDKRAKGAAVWVVSPEGATSEMGKWLEQREKSSNKLGGVESLQNKDPLLAKVLLDLSTTYSVGASLDAAEQIRKRMSGAVVKMHQNRVQRAGFVVLKMPDIPGILVETGFITNPTEERLLNTYKYRQKIANAVLSGLVNYFQTSPPDGTLFADRAFRKQLSGPTTHVVQRGDTLSEIASRYQVTISALKKRNKLRSDVVRIGQKIAIP